LGIISSGNQIPPGFLARAASGPGYTGKTRKYDVEWNATVQRRSRKGNGPPASSAEMLSSRLGK
jgi:hypothetical protein